MGELAGWSYWKVISITGQAGAGTDYQVELEIGDSAGGDFHLEGHCTNFPQDIRITDDDGTTLLDYWVEDLTADPIVVHVEVKDDLGSNQDIRVYYGKSGEIAASSISNTMILGDDFSGASLDSSKWKEYHDLSEQTIGTYTSISSGILTINPGASNQHSSSIVSLVTDLPDEAIMTLRFKSADGGSYPYSSMAYGNGALRYNGGNAHWGLSLYNSYYINGVYRQLKKVVANSGTVLEDETQDAWNSYMIFDFKLETSEIRVMKNDVEYLVGEGSNLLSGTQQLLVSAGKESNGGGNIYVEYIFVRKYNSPEPAFSSAGAEQTPPVGAIMSRFQRANIGADLYNGVFA